MAGKFILFAKDERGAVTVDWVVLTAGIVALNIFLLVGVLKDGMSFNALFIADKAENAATSQ